MAERKKLENVNAPLAFKVANEVYNKRMGHTEGRKWLSTHGGFNNNTAGDLIADFRYLMEGESFERTLNGFYATYFLEHIYEMYGRNRLQQALRSLQQHINYYEGHYRTNMHTMRGIILRFDELLTMTEEDTVEQEVVECEVESNSVTKDELLARIRLLERDDNLVVEIRGLALKRKNWIIGLIKKLREHRCQVCGTQIAKKGGGYYIEAAHITPKAEGGQETLDNIVILCPNHHKMFDWGEVEIRERKTDSLTLILNGETHRISLLHAAEN